MEDASTRRSGPVIAGVFGLIALAIAILGALVFVDHINLAGTHASVPAQQAPSPNPAPAPAAPDQKN